MNWKPVHPRPQTRIQDVARPPQKVIQKKLKISRKLFLKFQSFLQQSIMLFKTKFCTRSEAYGFPPPLIFHFCGVTQFKTF